MTIARAHILTVSTTWHFCRDREHCDYWRGEVPCRGHREMDFDIVCPYPEDMLGELGRDCSMYTECGCVLDDDQEEELYGAEEQECPNSLTGMHYCIHNADIFPARPETGCWARWCGCTAEHVEVFQEKHGDGVWAVLLESGSPECDEGVDFYPIARVEA